MPYAKLCLYAFLLASPLLAAETDEPLTRREEKLLERIDMLEQRLAALEARLGDTTPAGTAAPPNAPQVQQAGSQPSPEALKGNPVPDLLRDTTINMTMDGYYSYNFNAPIGRVNLLRAFDVSSNAFSLNQASLVIERPPDASAGRRWGARLDLQYGQATETLQGNPGNEPRPDVYRAVFQAYGTYIFPVGNGLTVDFGKWASALGVENNYTKDQMNYSRSYWFNFLPFYHMGVRVNYKFNNWFAGSYWMTNGTQQTEPFNGFKDQFFGLNLQPHKTVSWAVNYYLGQEHADVEFFPNGGQSGLPTEQGLPFKPIRPAPDGRLHIFDSYLTWQASPRLTMALEGDYVIERLWSYSAPSRASGSAGYARYQMTPKLAVAGRAEYLSDRGGLFSGATQALKETTVTAEYKLAEGFLVRQEWRRDFSNHPFFLTDTLGILKKEQNTATLGLVWWFGGKQGVW